MSSFWNGVLATLGGLCCLVTLMVVLYPLMMLWFGFGNTPTTVFRNWRADRRLRR